MGDAPYMEVTLTYVDNNGTEVTQSVKPTERVTKQHAVTAGFRQATASVGYNCVVEAEAGKGRQAMQAM